MIDFMNIAAEYGRIHCVKVLLEVLPEMQPLCLDMVIRYQHQNVDLFRLLLAKSPSARDLICDVSKIKSYALKYDLVDIMTKLIEDRWYRMEEGDVIWAHEMGAPKCYELLNTKWKAMNSSSSCS